jgi:hypothetical protein
MLSGPVALFGFKADKSFFFKFHLGVFLFFEVMEWCGIHSWYTLVVSFSEKTDVRY